MAVFGTRLSDATGLEDDTAPLAVAATSFVGREGAGADGAGADGAGAEATCVDGAGAAGIVAGGSARGLGVAAAGAPPSRT